MLYQCLQIDEEHPCTAGVVVAWSLTTRLNFPVLSSALQHAGRVNSQCCHLGIQHRLALLSPCIPRHLMKWAMHIDRAEFPVDA